jgi:hypothetical protein
VRFGRCDLASPQDRLHPGGKLARTKRLGEVIVGTKAESKDLVALFALRGENNDRHTAFRTEQPTHLEAVVEGQHEIEDHEVRTDIARHLKCRLPV